jgi:hypothetical protein
MFLGDVSLTRGEPMPKPRRRAEHVARYVLAGLVRVDAGTTRLDLEPLAGGAGFWLDVAAAGVPAGVGVGWLADVLVPVVVGLHPPPVPGKATKYPKAKGVAKP